jgi:hypothetical protein
MGGVAYVAIMIVAMLMLPPSSEVPPQFAAAEVLWSFRWASRGDAMGNARTGIRGCR